MPKKFEECIRRGGRIRTKKLAGGKYLHLCFPKGGGASVAGEIKKAKKKK